MNEAITEDQQFEVGHSFVPEPPESPALEASPEAGAAQKAVRGQVRCVFEDRHEMSKDELASINGFEISITRIFETQSFRLPQFIEKIKATVESPYLDKRSKYQTCRGILQDAMGSYGIVRIGDSIDGSLHTGINEDYMMKMWEFLEKFREFFGEEMPDEDFDYFVRKYIGELALSFYITEKGCPALWYANNHDRKMDKIKEILNKYGIISSQQATALETQAKIAIRKVLTEHLAPELYSGSAGGGKDESLIRRLAEKYGIELPTELEYWQKRVSEEMQSLEEIVRKFEEDKKEPFVKYEIERKSKVIAGGLEVLRAGFSKFDSSVLPDGVSSMDNWIQTFNEQLVAVKKFNLRHLFKEREEKLAKDFKKALDDRDSNEIRRCISFYDDLIKEAGEDLSLSVNVTDLIRQKISGIDSEITALSQGIFEDLSSAERNGEAISALGKLRNILDAGLKKFSEAA